MFSSRIPMLYMNWTKRWPFSVLQWRLHCSTCQSFRVDFSGNPQESISALRKSPVDLWGLTKDYLIRSAPNSNWNWSYQKDPYNRFTRGAGLWRGEGLFFDFHDDELAAVFVGACAPRIDWNNEPPEFIGIFDSRADVNAAVTDFYSSCYVTSEHLV